MISRFDLHVSGDMVDTYGTGLESPRFPPTPIYWYTHPSLVHSMILVHTINLSALRGCAQLSALGLM